jgi:hypothetical protein
VLLEEALDLVLAALRKPFRGQMFLEAAQVCLRPVRMQAEPLMEAAAAPQSQPLTSAEAQGQAAAMAAPRPPQAALFQLLTRRRWCPSVGAVTGWQRAL